MPCPFCTMKPEYMVASNDLAYAVRDLFPVNPGHTLVIPRRHAVTWFDATREEQLAILDLVDQIKTELDAGDSPPDAYNFGVNVGTLAGQSVMHLHLHLMPRYEGDVSGVGAGVRMCVPERSGYTAPTE